MAEGGGSSDDPVYTYDLINRTFINEGDEILDNLTAEEKEEIEKVLHTIRATQATNPDQIRHKPIDSVELDWLAGNNSAETTGYQTKWALTVLQGIFCNFSSNIYGNIA